VFINKKRNDEREKMATPIENSQPPVIEPEPVAPEMPMAEIDSGYPAGGNGSGGIKPSVNNLKPSIISEGFEFIGEIISCIK
jgi:hypothetical protein